MSQRFSDEDAYELYKQHFLDQVLPELGTSAVAMTVLPSTEHMAHFDVQFATELGALVMLDKPILALAPPGTKVPRKMIAVVDELVEVDPTTMGTPDTQKRIADALLRLKARYGV